jgi:beta-glucuronidase
MKDCFFTRETVWYRKTFHWAKQPGKKLFLRFLGVNYLAEVYVNGNITGAHEGGFTAFQFDVTDLVHDGHNFIVVKVNNERQTDRIPAIDFDWWNYGGILRDVELVELPSDHIENYMLQLKKGSLEVAEGWIQLGPEYSSKEVSVEIPDLGFKASYPVNSEGRARISFKQNFDLWSPENPKRYSVILQSDHDCITTKIGFRSIETIGKQIYLNGSPVYLRGISLHDEAPFRQGRVENIEDARILLGWAKELNCNYVRLAHYAHHPEMLKMADEMGLMVWAEIPVWQDIDFTDIGTLTNAKIQMEEMIRSFWNHASIIIWSVANETHEHAEGRLIFLQELIAHTRTVDSTRLISAALFAHKPDKYSIEFADTLGYFLDVLAMNEYIGWYGQEPEDCLKMQWSTRFDKPHIISEFGAGALAGFHGNKETIWSEEYQARVYTNQLKMLDNVDFISGVSPWILMDFMSPRRRLSGYQDFFNRKGLVSETGQKKQAFFIMQDYYKKRSIRSSIMSNLGACTK